MKNNSGAAIRDYMDLVNRPGFLDSAAAGFARQADRTPGFNKAQRRESGFLTGFAGGLQGAANQQRNSKLEEIEQLANQVAMVQGNLALQQGAGELMKTQAINFTASRKPEIFALAGALKSGNVDDIDQLFRLISTDAANEIPGFKEKYGTYDHAVGGKIYFTKNGDTRGYGQKELFSQLPLEEVFGENAVELEPLLNNFQKYESKAMLEKLELDKLRADVASKYAQTNLANAQTRGVETDTAAKQMEMTRPPVNKDLLKKTYNTNVDWIDKQNEQVQKAEVKNIVYDRLENIIKNESAAGGTLFDWAAREYKKQTGKDAKITEARNLQKYFFSDIKGVAGNPNQKEWDDLVSRLVSIEQNPDAALETINLEKKLNKDLISNYNNTVNALKERDYGLLYSDPEIKNRVKELQGQAENTQRIDKLNPLGTADPNTPSISPKNYKVTWD